MTELHQDILLAKAGDPKARARVAIIANLDPAAYARARDEVAEALRERWQRRPTETDAEYHARVAAEALAWRALEPQPTIPIDDEVT